MAWQRTPLWYPKKTLRVTIACPRCHAQHTVTAFKFCGMRPDEATHWCVCPIHVEPVWLWMASDEVREIL